MRGGHDAHVRDHVVLAGHAAHNGLYTEAHQGALDIVDGVQRVDGAVAVEVLARGAVDALDARISWAEDGDVVAHSDVERVADVDVADEPAPAPSQSSDS